MRDTRNTEEVSWINQSLEEAGPSVCDDFEGLVTSVEEQLQM